MSNRNFLAFIPMAYLLAAGFLAVAPTANAASAWQSLAKAGEGVKNYATEIKYRRRGARLQLPIVPYIAYDYPYYYSRGFYPTHIGPGYIYYGYPYKYYKRTYYPTYARQCASRHRRCVAN